MVARRTPRQRARTDAKVRQVSAPSPRLRDRACVVAFLALWHAPVLYHGAVSQWPARGEPWLLHRCHDITCLFIDRTDTTHSYYLQAIYPGRDWQTVDPFEYFPMEPFGHRTRMYRFLAYWRPERQGGRDELAAFVFRRHRELHPDDPQPTAVRFVHAWSKRRADVPPTGAWQAPPLSQVPPRQRRVLSTHTPVGAAT
jgi:hypothetical protein